jgi:membrane-bound lytic murein transglycosylase F
MMLTEETADFLGVGNRLDPAQSIPAGARYLNYLRSQIPASTPEPDRTWQALAAYNIGPGHFAAARRLAARLGVDGDSWPEMKKILPLLARPAYYSHLKSGKARGGEAVILVENIRVFYDILTRYEKPFAADSAGLGDGKESLGPKPFQGVARQPMKSWQPKAAGKRQKTAACGAVCKAANKKARKTQNN